MKNKLHYLIVSAVFILLSFHTRAQTCGAGFNYTLNGNIAVFTDTSWAADSIQQSEWSVNGMFISPGFIVTYQFPQPGTYWVCHYIYTPTCTDSACEAIVVSGCNLSAAAQYDSLNNVIVATATGGAQPYTYYWNNGSTQPVITPTSAGTYCVTVTDANGCSANACYNYSGAGPCVVTFSYQYVPGTNDMTFTAYSPGADSLSWDFSDGTGVVTTTSFNYVHTFPNSGSYFVCCTTWVAGVACNAYCNYVYIPPVLSSVVCGNVFGDLNANAVADSSEGPSNSIYYGWIYGGSFQATIWVDSLTGNYSVNVPAGTYTLGFCTNNGATFSVPLPDSVTCASYTITIGANDTLCGYNFGVVEIASLVSGRVFIDANNNGVMNAGESGAAYQMVQLGSVSTWTDYNGYYSAYLPVGNVNITYSPAGMYNLYNLTTPGTIPVNVSSVGQVYSGNNFGIYLPGGTVDLAVNISPHTTVTPGFPAWYDIMVYNLGNTAVGAQVSMFYDAALTFDYASPVQATHDAINHVLTWNITNIQPGGSTMIWVDFNALVSTPLGSVATNMVTVNPSLGIDANPANNTDSTHQICVGSWDPNNKLVTRSNIFNNPNTQTISSIDSDQLLHYTINFQNTGTAVAHNVVVIDDMSSLLDENSFTVTGTSHNCVITRNGSEVTYKFLNIMLPDSNSNEPMSHGFINFEISADMGIPAGTFMADHANIYFDFNAPVLTNDAIVEFVNPLSIKDVTNNANLFLFPVPASNQVNISFSSEGGMTRAELVQADGKIIETILNENMVKGQHQLMYHTQHLADGFYYLRLMDENGSRVQKLTVKH